MRKRFCAIVLAVAMVMSLIPAAMAASPSRYEDTAGHWAEASIERWSGYGVVGGVGNDLFAPDNTLTRAEAAQIFANLLGLTATASLSQYADVAVGSWYYDAIAKCVAAGILNGTGAVTMSPEAMVTRQELFVMYARALSIQPKDSANTSFTDSASVASWAAGYINALADMGAVRGSGDGSLDPTGDINRASFMALLDQSISGYANTDNATVGGTSGIVLVVADNVTVMGNVENLVVVGGSAGISGSTVGTVTVTGDDASVSVGGSASVGQVNVTGANASVSVSGQASVTTVTVADTAVDTTVTVTGDATVDTVDSAAAGVTISGTGTVGSATVSGDNTTVDTDGTDLTVTEGTTGVTENDKPVAGGDNVITEAGQTTPEQPSQPSQPSTPVVPSYTYYDVTFMLDEETVYTTQRVREGRTAQEPEDPTKEGYTFGGWFAEDAETAYDFETPVTDDLTLTAAWILNDYTITLRSTDTSVADVITGAAHGATLDKDALEELVAVTGYRVTSWTLDGETYDFTTPVTSNLILVYTMQVNNYTVTYMMPDGTSSSQGFAYGATVTYPTVDTKDGYTWHWYSDSAYQNEVTSGMTMPTESMTVYGQWTHTTSGLKGEGTESNPFLIGTADEFFAVGTLQNSDNHFKLTANIDMTSHAASQTDKYGDTGDIYCLYGELDGDGHTIRGKDSVTGVILYAIDAVIKDVSFIDVTHAAVTNATNTTFENVTVTGMMEVSNNCAAFVIYAVPSNGEVELTFNNCTADVDMYGGGGQTDYNAVFVGYAYPDGNKTTLTFNNCVNEGELHCGKAAMFLGNNSDNDGIVTINVNNCENNGVIHTALKNPSATMNIFIATGTNADNTVNTVVLSGETLTGTAQASATLGGTGSYVREDKNSLDLTVREENGAFVITSASNEGVDHYVVTMALYARLLNANGTEQGGTMVVRISETVSASAFQNGSATTTLRNLSFVDEDWTQSTGAEAEARTDASGNTVYSLNGTDYYYIGDEADTHAGLRGTATAATIVSVSAYDAQGRILVSFSK